VETEPVDQNGADWNSLCCSILSSVFSTLRAGRGGLHSLASFGPWTCLELVVEDLDEELASSFGSCLELNEAGFFGTGGGAFGSPNAVSDAGINVLVSPNRTSLGSVTVSD